MTEQDIRNMLTGNSKGKQAAENIDQIMRKLDTPDVQKQLAQIKKNPITTKAMHGGEQELSALIRELMSSPEGQQLIKTVKQAADGS